MEQQKLSSDLDGSDRHVNKDTDVFKLNEDLLLHILSFLPMKQVVRISSSSKRWMNLWKSVPKIDFSQTNIAKTPQLIAAVDIALSNREALKIMEFRVHAECDLCPMDKVESWIDSVVKHKVEVLYLDLIPHSKVHEDYPLIPDHLFQSKSLTALTLKFCMIDLPPNFCLVSLKTLHFGSVEFDDEELTILLSNCPVLKDLTLEKCNSVTDLKIIAMDSHLENLNVIEEDSSDSDGETVFEICAPNLMTLNFFRRPRRSNYILRNLDSLVSINFDFWYPSNFTAF